LLRPWAYHVVRPHRASRKNPGIGAQSRNRGGGDDDLHFGRDFTLLLSMGRIGGSNQFRLCILRSARFGRRALFADLRFHVPHHFGKHGDPVFQFALPIKDGQPEGAHQQKIDSRTSRSNDRYD
jgi:hypothetical protein